MKIVKQVGDVKLIKGISIENMLYVPDFRHNLLSVSKLLQGIKMKFIFDEHECIFKEPITRRRWFMARMSKMK